jgi:hypothetical protein
MPVNKATGSSISYEIRGYDRVRNNLRGVIAAHPKEVNEVMRRWAEDTRMFLKRTAYPPKPANSRYTRTGRLASSWKKEQVKPAVWGITNNAKGVHGQFYARYVVGDWQTRGHKMNNWWRAAEVVEKVHVPELRLFLEEMYIKLWDK